MKLLDFGIAKLVQEGAEAGASTSGPRPDHALTPEYAAPEQLLGEEVTTATDVYSLRVLLYQLLTGRHPQYLPVRLLGLLSPIDAGAPSPARQDRRAATCGGAPSISARLLGLGGDKCRAAPRRPGSVRVNLACSLARYLSDGAIRPPRWPARCADRLMASATVLSAPSRVECRINRGFAELALGNYTQGVTAMRNALATLEAAGVREGEQRRGVK